MRGQQPINAVTGSAPMRAAMRATLLCLSVAAGALFAGCGADDYPNTPKPAQTKTLSVLVGEKEIAVSPRDLGAGPTRFVLTNQTGTDQDVTVSTERLDRTVTIEPSQTSNFKLDIGSGPLTIEADNTAAEPVELTIGPDRPSAQQDLGQP